MSVSRLFLIAIFLITSSSWAAAGIGPRISFDRNNHDYGQVAYGDVVTTVFNVSNSGDEKLVILKLTASCGCTRPVAQNLEVPPGGKTEIIVTFDATRLKKAGVQRQSVSVVSNDPVNPSGELKLVADVIRQLSYEPETLAIRLPVFQERVVFKVKASNSSDKPVAIVMTGVQGEGVKAMLKPERVLLPPRSEETFAIELQIAEDRARAPIKGVLFLATDHPKESRVGLPYLVMVGKGQ
jgi:hypothetical protein